MLDTRRSTWTTLRRHLTRRRPHQARHPRSVAVVPLRSVLAAPGTDGVTTQDTAGAVAPRRSLRTIQLAGLNPADALSRMLPD